MHLDHPKERKSEATKARKLTHTLHLKISEKNEPGFNQVILTNNNEKMKANNLRK